MRTLYTIIILLFVFLACKKDDHEWSLQKSTQSFHREYIADLQNPIQDKNFYWLSLIQRSPTLYDRLKLHPDLQRYHFKFQTALKGAQQTCAGSVSCVDQLLRWSKSDIEDCAAILSDLATDEPAMIDLIETHLRPSGFYIRYDSLSNGPFLANLWEESVQAINRLLAVYGKGVSPRYPEIDRVGFQVNSDEYQELIQNKLDELVKEDPELLFFEPSLNYAMELLTINGRNEAGRYEPIQEGENKSLIEYIPSIDFQLFEYALILVPGDSPNSPGDLPNISLGGMARADYGVELYKKGLAPIIGFSGGAVRPFKTQFSEAIEMKKYVMQKHNVPEAAILVDPFARHTTTNLRNISRYLIRYGFPLDRNALVATTQSQSNYIMSTKFKDRCQEELGYLPVDIIRRTSDRTIEFQPKKISLQVDARDPLDP